jgi:hypothetical protein
MGGENVEVQREIPLDEKIPPDFQVHQRPDQARHRVVPAFPEPGDSLHGGLRNQPRADQVTELGELAGSVIGASSRLFTRAGVGGAPLGSGEVDYTLS